MRWLNSAFFIVLVPLLASACSDDTNNGDESPNGLVEGVCAYLDRCAGTFGRMHADQETCESAFSQSGEAGCEARAIDGDPADIEACLEALAQAACVSLDLANLYGDRFAGVLDDFADCQRIAASAEDVTARAGTGCDATALCPNGYGCFIDSGELAPYGTCGLCEPLHETGQDCESDSACAEGLYCDADGHCAVPVADGQPCNRLQACSTGYCDSETNTCTPKLELQSPCQTQSQCLSGWCDYGECNTILGYESLGQACENNDLLFGNLACIDGALAERSGPGGPCESGWTDCLDGHACSQGQCVKVDPCSTLQDGDPCTPAYHTCPTRYFCAVDLMGTCANCNDGYSCIFSAGGCDGVQEVCVAPAALGEECYYGGCAQDLYCDGSPGSCQEQKQIGEECPNDRSCIEGSFCQSDQCAALLSLDEPCTNSRNCESGWCDMDLNQCKPVCTE